MPVFFDTDDLRARFGTNGKPTSKGFIHNLVKANKLPPSALLGGKRVWRRADIEAMEAKLFGASAD
ncbi:hypothetical protein [Bradyrhizobium sp. CCBAU 11357]|uniref:hypothetical protein n=1 Tax=Bradyrhizobium sp. CCBAU 11357 TaxID=1630808 RepID=UPI0023042EC7|nr:hypothetical protein [Bradyrhizobium sp. CCBAU 11357]MDA9498442.1 hypothetical protein [Bradyrhizobium sp. CCBAU 11357]